MPAVQTTPWRIPTRDPVADRELATQLGTSPMLAALVRNRGLTDAARARAWLEPRLRDLSHPFDVLDLERAARSTDPTTVGTKQVRDFAQNPGRP